MLGFGHKKHAKHMEITVSNGTVLRVLALVIVSLLLLAAIQQAAHALLLLFVAFFLALALNAPVHWIAERLPGKKRGNRTLATALSFVIVVALLTSFVASLAPPLVRQTGNFIDQAPNLVEDLHDENTTVGAFVHRHNLESQVDKFSGQLSDRLQNISGAAFNSVTRVSSSVFAMLTVWVLTFMMLIEGPRWLEIGRRLLPEDREEHVTDLTQQMYQVVKGYVNGQVILAALAAAFIAIPIFILNISYPVALVVVVFICGLIPMVGHYIGAAIVSVVALFHSPLAAIVILAYYILYQQIENYAVQPKIQAMNTKMTPLLVFASVVIGVSFSGLLGGLLAIPIAGCIRIVVLDYIERKKLLSPLPPSGTK